jgi:hypothetical protein
MTCRFLKILQHFIKNYVKRKAIKALKNKVVFLYEFFEFWRIESNGQLLHSIVCDRQDNGQYGGRFSASGRK